MLNKNNIKNNLIVILICSIFLLSFSECRLISQVNADPTNFQKTGEIIVTADAAEDQIWTDEQWIFYKAILGIHESVTINLTYSGDLDLDLQLYVDDNPIEQEVLAWDITHCGLDADEIEDEPTRNSQVRGTNSIETVTYENAVFYQARNVYILVFCYDYFEEEGSSSFTIESNQDLQEIEKKDLVKSDEHNRAWLFYGIGSGIAIMVAALIGNYAKIPRKERKIMKIERMEQQKKDAEIKARQKEAQDRKKKQASMQKRRSNTRRR